MTGDDATYQEVTDALFDTLAALADIRKRVDRGDDPDRIVDDVWSAYDIDEATYVFDQTGHPKAADPSEADNDRMESIDDADDDADYYQQGHMILPIPDRADRDEPLPPPDIEEYAKQCPDCDASPDPWVGDNTLGVGFDVTIIDGVPTVVVEGECTCGWTDRSVIQD